MFSMKLITLLVLVALAFVASNAEVPHLEDLALEPEIELMTTGLRGLSGPGGKGGGKGPGGKGGGKGPGGKGPGGKGGGKGP